MRLKKLVASALIGCLVLGSTAQGTQVFAANKTKVTQTKIDKKKQTGKQKNGKKTEKNKQIVAKRKEALRLKNRVKEAQLNAAKIKSVEATMKMVMDMNMEYEGEKQSIPMRMTGKITSFQEPVKAKIDLKTNFMGNTRMQYYLEEKEGKVIAYMNLGGEWQSIEIGDENRTAQMNQLNAVENIDQFLNGITNLKELGKEKVDGKTTTKIEGILSKEALKSMLEATSVLNMENLSDEEQEMMNQMLKNMGNIKLTFWLTEDNQIVQMKEDLTELVSKMIESMSQELGTDGLKTGVSKLELTITYHKWNDVEDFTIPEEVYQAKKLEVPVV